METIVAKSDLLHIQELHPDTRTIQYTNENDYAGLIYNSDYPPTFMIRVESKFYTPEFPQEDESEDLGDGKVEKLSGSVKEQRTLELEPLPPYMHRKLIQIFGHNSLFIENQSWTKEENYKVDKLNDRFAFFGGEVVLTLKEDGYITNVF